MTTDDGPKGPMKPLFPILTVIVLCAALVFGYVLRADRTSTAEPSADPRSGEIRIVDPNPKAGIPRFRDFAWYYDLPTGGRYELTITCVATGERVVDALDTDLPDFQPTALQLDSMGTEIEMVVAAYGPDSDEAVSRTQRTFRVDE